MKDDYTGAAKTFVYKGKVSDALIDRAKRAFAEYRSDKAELMTRIKDDEKFYRDAYKRTTGTINAKMDCNTSFIFAAIENARADAVENYPVPNILERSETGTQVAEVLTRIIPAQLEYSGFRRVYKENVRNKNKYGTAIYGVFYNEFTKEIDIKALDIPDVYVDMHLSDIQDSPFMFICAAIDNDVLKKTYPKFSVLFNGDATIETLTDDYKLTNRTTVIDCYYKKDDGSLHMMKICKDTIIAATEDMDGYEAGMYAHGKYPVVFDVLYPQEHCPFGFGMIDIAKSTQIEINKLDNAITENVIVNSKPRYLTKRNGGIDESEFMDLQNNVVHYEGDTDALRPIQATSLHEVCLTHREYKKDELKELLANRDFQQGETTGGVTAASAIERLQQAGEKRSRSTIDDTYDAFSDIVYMTIELMRQFYRDEREFRVSDDSGQREFQRFSNKMMFAPVYTAAGVHWDKLQFDIDVVPQRENPYTRETANNTILTFWQSGLLAPENADVSVVALKNMNFDGKDKLIRDIRALQQQEESKQMQQEQMQSVPADMTVSQSGIDPMAMNAAQTARTQGMGSFDLGITGGV